MPRHLRVVFQLLPQPAHVNVSGAGKHSGVIAPNLAQQFIARKRSAALGDKVVGPEQIDFRFNYKDQAAAGKASLISSVGSGQPKMSQKKTRVSFLR